MATTQISGQGLPQSELDRLYDELAALVDRTPEGERERTLARLAVALIQELGSCDRARKAIAAVQA